MPDKVKEIVREYWKALIETLIVGILLVAFSQASKFFLFIAIVFTVTDVIVAIYSAYQGDPKFLIVEGLAYLFKGGSK